MHRVPEYRLLTDLVDGTVVCICTGVGVYASEIGGTPGVDADTVHGDPKTPNGSQAIAQWTIGD
jgi:hypothetical protein